MRITIELYPLSWDLIPYTRTVCSQHDIEWKDCPDCSSEDQVEHGFCWLFFAIWVLVVMSDIAEDTVSIAACSACGAERHDDLPIRPLGPEDEVEAMDVFFCRPFKFVALCPETQKKIFVSFDEP